MDQYDLKIKKNSQGSSKSLRKCINKQGYGSPSTPIKLNSHNLPQDFFGKALKMPPLPPKSVKMSKTKPLTDRKLLGKEKKQQKISQFLPQAQTTCFFKALQSQQIRTEQSLPYIYKHSSDTKLENKENFYRYLNGEDQDYTSIELNQQKTPRQSIDQLLYTFAKKSVDTYRHKCQTPLKKNNTYNHNDSQHTKTKSKSKVYDDRVDEHPYKNYQIKNKYFYYLEQHDQPRTINKNANKKKQNKNYANIVLPKISYHLKQ